uniref:Uncharacterized protein n=1 Tax=Laticauda laticaudata TaxID=8630 RepID=A0A8C5S557_LATLA
MHWPFSRRFSISISSFTPSTTICTSSTSENPRRSALEISNTPPTAAVSTPPKTNQNRSEEPKLKYFNGASSPVSSSRPLSRAGETPLTAILFLFFTLDKLGIGR